MPQFLINDGKVHGSGPCIISHSVTFCQKELTMLIYLGVLSLLRLLKKSVTVSIKLSWDFLLQPFFVAENLWLYLNELISYTC